MRVVCVVRRERARLEESEAGVQPREREHTLAEPGFPLGRIVRGTRISVKAGGPPCQEPVNERGRASGESECERVSARVQAAGVEGVEACQGERWFPEWRCEADWAS